MAVVNPQFQPSGVKDIRTPGTNTAPQPQPESTVGLAVAGVVVLGSAAAWFWMRRRS